MSFRTTEHAQWNEPATTAVTKRLARFVLDADGSYVPSTTGAADGVLVDDGTGSLVIQASGTEAADLVAVGSNFQILT